MGKQVLYESIDSIIFKPLQGFLSVWKRRICSINIEQQVLSLEISKRNFFSHRSVFSLALFICYIHFLNKRAYFHSVKHQLHCWLYCNCTDVFFHQGAWIQLELQFLGRNPCVDTLTNECYCWSSQFMLTSGQHPSLIKNSAHL